MPTQPFKGRERIDNSVKSYIRFEIGVRIIFFPGIGIWIKLHSWSFRCDNGFDLKQIPLDVFLGLAGL